MATKKKIGFLIRHRKDSNIVDIFCEILENGLIEVRINKFGDGEHLKTVKEIFEDLLKVFKISKDFSIPESKKLKHIT